MDVASDTPGPHESSANESSAGAIVGKDNGSKLMDDSPLVRSLFEPPGDLMCPITLELFKDPVSTAAGQVYERSAILSYWRMVEVAVDPLTRKELGSASLTPIHLIRSRARDYREQVARACVDLACSQNVFTPARYLRRAVHLLTDVEIQVNGLTAECVQFVQAHPDADDDRRILRSFSTSLYESGQAEAAAHVIGHLLQGEDRKGQVELMRQCCKYLGASRESMDAAAEKLAGFVQRQEALAAEEMIEVVQEADADLQLLMKLCERLLVDAPGAGLTQEQRGLIAKYVTISWAHLNRRVGVLEEASAASVELAQPVKQHGAAPAGPWYRAWLQDRRRAGATAAAAVLWVLAGTSPVVRVARVLPVLYLLHRR